MGVQSDKKKNKKHFYGTHQLGQIHIDIQLLLQKTRNGRYNGARMDPLKAKRVEKLRDTVIILYQRFCFAGGGGEL